MVKVVIIGGGIAGLSAATLLCDISNINIEIYEKEAELGGQAASQYNNNCNIEHSWRVFGKSYFNLWYIFNNILHINNHFQNVNNKCLITTEDISSMNATMKDLLPQILNNAQIKNYYKYFDFLFLSKN